MLRITNNRDVFYQWDIGQSLTVELATGETLTAVHIGIEGQKPLYIVEPINNIVAVYDELLQTGKPIIAYEYKKTGDDGRTVSKHTFKVVEREKADEYAYTPTQSYSWEYWCERARLYAVAAESSKNSAAASVSSIPATMTAWWNAHRSEFKGDTGAIGPQGPRGPQGPAGPSYDDTSIMQDITDIYNALDHKASDTDLANEQRRIDYLYMVNEGITYNWETDDDEAYVKNVPSGAVQMGVNKIGGKSVVVNQLLPFDSDFSYTNPNIGIEFKNSNGRITANGTALVTATPSILPSTIYRQIKPKVGHKHFIKFSGNHNLDMLKFYVFYSGGGVLSVDANTIFTTTSEASEGEWVAKFTKDQSYTCDFTSCLIDLTQMFGAGNEPSLAECQQIFSNDYYPYNTGELVSASSKKIVSKGRNLWNEQTESGAIDSTGTPYDNTNRIRANGYIEVEPSTSYYLYCGKLVGTSTANIFGFWYDKDKTPIKHDGTNVVVNACNTNIGSPSNAKYFRFFLGGAYGMTYLNDTAFIKGTSGTYTPYKEPTELTTDYGVLRSAGSVYDYVDLDRGVLVRRVGTVDLGSLTWNKLEHATYGTYFYTNAKPLGVKRLGQFSYYVHNLLCKKYITTKRASNEFVNKCICADGDESYVTQFQIIDNDYTDTTSFKSAMNGVKLFYELATPTEEPITVKGNTLDIESGGTITFVSDVTDYHIPVPSEETYMVKVSEV